MHWLHCRRNYFTEHEVYSVFNRPSQISSSCVRFFRTHQRVRLNIWEVNSTNVTMKLILDPVIIFIARNRVSGSFSLGEFCLSRFYILIVFQYIFFAFNTSIVIVIRTIWHFEVLSPECLVVKMILQMTEWSATALK